MKKMLYGVLAFILMIIPIATPHAATSEYTITIKAKEGMKAFEENRFKAFQIFSGTTDESNPNLLSNIDWGNGVDNVNLLNGLKKDNTLKTYFQEASTAGDVAGILADNSTEETFLNAFSKVVKNYTSGSGVSSTMKVNDAIIDVGEPGYYIILDTDNNANSKENGISDFILAVLGKKTIKIKAAIPGIDKKIVVDGNTVSGITANIGSEVKFRLTGTLADNYADFTSYYYAFNDTLSEGFTLDTDSIVVKIDDVTLAKSDYSIAESSNNQLKVVIDNLKAITTKKATVNSKIVVEYTATVNNSAKINNNANTNSAFIEYSNDRNNASNKGKTATVTAYVYTFSLDIKKIDGSSELGLENAQFIISKENSYAIFEKNGTTYKFKEWTETKAEATRLATGEDGNIHIEGLAKGEYLLEETKAPIGYNKLSDSISFEIKATINDAGQLNNYAVETDSSYASVSNSVITIANYKGAELPSAGGIGTTLFYILGGLLLVGGISFVVYKKKSNI